MLKEVRAILKAKLGQYLIDENITAYRGRKDKIKFNSVSFNTVYRLVKKDDYPLRNETIILLLEFIGVAHDENFLNENSIVKLYEEDNSEAIPSHE